jgi:hypothetical protein
MCDCGYHNKDIRDQLIDIILKVAMKHYDDISKQDEDAACDAADEILKQHVSNLSLLFRLQDKLPVESQITIASGLNTGINIVVEYVNSLLEEIKQLKDSNEAWRTSDKIFIIVLVKN